LRQSLKWWTMLCSESLPLRRRVPSLLVLVYKHRQFISHHPFILLHIQCGAKLENLLLGSKILIRNESATIVYSTAYIVGILPLFADLFNLLFWLLLVTRARTNFISQQSPLHVNIVTHMLAERGLLPRCFRFKWVDDNPAILLDSRVNNPVLQVTRGWLCAR